MIKSVMQGKDEGADSSEGDESIIGEKTSGIAGKVEMFCHNDR